MPPSAGLYNTFCTVLEATKVQDTTSHEMVRTWANMVTTVTGEYAGTGDGTTLIFYTVNTNVIAIPSVYVDGVLMTLTTHYSISQLAGSSQAKITFTEAGKPALDAVVTCTYTHNASNTIPCRLDESKGGVRVSATDWVSVTTPIIFMGYRTDIDWKNKRIQVGSVVYDVILAKDAGGEQDHLEVSLEYVE